MFADVQTGTNIIDINLNDILKNLYNTNFFKDVLVEINDDILKIKVLEAPIINKVEIKGIKAKKYKEALSDYLGLKEKSSFIKNAVKHDVKIIREFYKAQGFYFVSTRFKHIRKISLLRIKHFA